MKLTEAIEQRRSVRSYKAGAEVSDEQVRELLAAAMRAPSACNSRPWGFIVVRNRGKLEEMRAAHSAASMLKTASLAIIVTADLELQKGRSEGYFPQDCGAATQNLLLKAVDLGLGACWCGVYPKPRVDDFRRILDLPPNIVPFNMIALGVPDEGSTVGTGRGFYEEGKVQWLL